MKKPRLGIVDVDDQFLSAAQLLSPERRTALADQYERPIAVTEEEAAELFAQVKRTMTQQEQQKKGPGFASSSK